MDERERYDGRHSDLPGVEPRHIHGAGLSPQEQKKVQSVQQGTARLFTMHTSSLQSAATGPAIAMFTNTARMITQFCRTTLTALFTKFMSGS
jgi:hypothetical protein